MRSPGTFLKKFINTAKSTQKELAEKTGLSTATISDYVNDKLKISEENASKIAHTLDFNAEDLLNVQTKYLLAKTQSNPVSDEEIDLIKNFYDYNYLNTKFKLEKINNLRGKDRYAKMVEGLRNYFNTTSLTTIQSSNKYKLFRNYKHTVSMIALAAWLRLGEKEARRKLNNNLFQDSYINELISILRKMLGSRIDSKELIKTFDKFGIKLIVSPYFRQTYVNGAVYWLDGTPVIQINDKGKYEDITWFTLFHEIGHLKLHSRKETYIDSYKLSYMKISQKEIEANEFAKQELLDETELLAFTAQEDFSIKSIVNFAQELKVDPGIVAGRLASDQFISWSAAAKLRKKVKLLLIN